jgi:cardiolipin synthase A/B
MRPQWLKGNRLTLLENGEGFYPRVFEAIAAAEREVLLETFILFDDEVGRDLQQALLAAARRGAEVHVLVDGWGSADLPDAFTRPLIDAGVRLRSFEPAQRLFGTRMNMLRRMHRKLVVVDGQRAFVGGINFSVDHLKSHGPQGKQDFAVEVRGPVVGHVRAFCRAGIEAPEPPRRRWLARWRDRRRPSPSAQPGDGDHPAGQTGGAEVAFVTRDNRGHRTDIERQYRLALRAARQRVVIANAYFFPGYRLLNDLRRAARRGVQVDLILQGMPDLPWVRTAASLLYGHLVRAGVQVYEFKERPLHAKVAVVDGDWATIGSSNLDPTSLGLNLEANLVVRDEAFAVELRERLDRLLEGGCERIRPELPGRLRSAWIALRSAVVFHLMRRFPVWARQLAPRPPRVVPLRPESP